MQGSAVLHPGREERESVLRQHGSCPVRNGGFMKKRDIYGYLIGIGAAELVGLLARLFSGAGNAFYGTLKQPPLAPPGWVFPVAWAILYAMMGAASYLVYGSDSEQRSSALALYAIQLAVNFSWTLVFFPLPAYRRGGSGSDSAQCPACADRCAVLEGSPECRDPDAAVPFVDAVRAVPESRRLVFKSLRRRCTGGRQTLLPYLRFKKKKDAPVRAHPFCMF